MRDDVLRLADMLEALEHIRSFTVSGQAQFFADQKTQEAVAYEILKLGEAAGRVTPTFRRSHRTVPWQRLIRLRNEIVHEYFRLELEDIWEFASRELDQLERGLRAVSHKAD